MNASIISAYAKRLQANFFGLAILVAMIAAGAHAEAQSVWYLHKPLSPDGCELEYFVSKQGDEYYIIATVSSDRLRFIDEPTLKIRTFGGHLIELRGAVIENEKTTKSVIEEDAITTKTEISATAQFVITPQEFELIKEGVAKIRLSMTPMNHERIFKSDRIGEKLYMLYLKEMQQDEDF